jgi:hypothetical protein
MQVPQSLHRVASLVSPERRQILVLGEGFGQDRLCYATCDVMPDEHHRR